MTSCDLDRSAKSPSPLSCWTKVFPDPDSLPDTNRKIFTILPDENAEYSPRLPELELTKLEAKGMVTLSSDWTQEGNQRSKDTMPQQMNYQNQSHKRRPIQIPSVLNSVDRKGFKRVSDDNPQDADEEDDLIIVTDKTTQTHKPWPFSSESSLEEDIRQEHDNECINIEASSIKNQNTISSNDTDYNKSHDNTHNNDVDYNNGKINESKGYDSPSENEKDLHQGLGQIIDDAKISEAPTLKVEYVGKIWDAYINDFLLASDHISEAAIYDRGSKSCIACSQQFVLSEDELAHLSTSLNCLSVAYRCGVKINNRYFKTILADGRRGLMAKGEEHDGCSACQTRSLILIAVHDKRAKGRRCNEELMRLGDFFWAKGL